MRAQWQTIGSTAIWFVTMCGFASTAAAQAPPVQDGAVDVAIGFTTNTLSQDVNAAPACVDLNFPCTHEHPAKFSGAGLTGAVAANITRTLAIAGDVSAFSTAWTQRDSPLASSTRRTIVTSFAAGPRVSTGFFDPGTGDREPGRFFAQLLAGAEVDRMGPARPVVVVGAGTDVLFPHRSSPGAHAPGLRLAFDYRRVGGGGRNFSGWRLVAGLLLGPRA